MVKKLTSPEKLLPSESDEDDENKSKPQNKPIKLNNDDEEKKPALIVNHVPREIREEAEEGRHLYIDFVRREIQRNGLDTPPELSDNVDMQVSSEHQRYVWFLV